MIESVPPSKVVSHVSVLEKLVYGMASFVDSWPVWIPLALASPVLTMQLGIKPWVVSLLFVSFRCWDAMTDPLMGWISDNTNSRWGRRRPYIFVGAILIGVTFPLMWFFPRDASQEWILAWMVVSGLLLYSSLGVWAMPYHSLYMELTPDYNERTRINSYRFIFAILFGLAIGWSWSLTQLDIFRDPVTGAPDTLRGTRYVTVVMGAIMVVFGVLPALFVRERFANSEVVKQRKKSRLRDDLRLTLQNRNFLILIFVTVFFVSSTALVKSFGQFIIGYYVLEGDLVRASTFNGLTQTIYTVGVLVGIFTADFLSPRWGKKQVMMIALVTQLLGCLLTYFVLWPNAPYLTLINPIFLGFGSQATWLLVGSMVADIADEDELATGTRREGSYSSTYSWVVKMSFTLGFGASGPLLELTGFDVNNGADQIDVFFRMKLMMTLLPVFVLLVAIFVLRYYSLTAENASETRARLEARRQKSSN
ncbi:MFS transporter [Neorhodopirellula pilleata]|uniref:Inner membrane symporter YicJ n=1 Tax=Neorhodopirellula pilleata TaxID=2714738 RepID=A0A5C5ZGN4_9BACT|nr:MFS transporter [Neorhodopirellula pilleata]TWT86386.1 Inner membrane symporter YicJ [Neorhodopirellula pilleata]